MKRRRRTWSERRPIPACEVGVLHAFGPGFLHAPNKVLEFRGSGDRVLRIPLRGLRLVCLYGPVRVTAGAIRLVTDGGAGLSYLSADGMRTNGVLHPPQDSWRSRRYRQYTGIKNREWTLIEARRIVSEKIAGISTFARRCQRRGKAVCDSELLTMLSNDQLAAEAAQSLESLRGLEGTATRRWFQIFTQILPSGWDFPGRKKRPPPDPINALLSLGYTLLQRRVEAACVSWGLDAALGVLHEYRPGRASLACDLCETFRVPLVDRVLIGALERCVFSVEDFETDPQRPMRIRDAAVKRWITELETALHTRDGSGSSYNQMLFEQVQGFVDRLPTVPGDTHRSNADQHLNLFADESEG